MQIKMGSCKTSLNHPDIEFLYERNHSKLNLRVRLHGLGERISKFSQVCSWSKASLLGCLSDFHHDC